MPPYLMHMGWLLREVLQCLRKVKPVVTRTYTSLTSKLLLHFINYFKCIAK